MREPPAQPRAARRAPAAAAVHPLKTYIVEDNLLIRDSLIATLDELVCIDVVGTAEDEATAVLWLGDPDHDAELVIVDIFLRAGSGLGVLRAAGQRPRPRRKLVVLTNYATEDMRRRCLGLGADRVFDKSNDIDELVQYCARLAGGGHSAPGALALP